MNKNKLLTIIVLSVFCIGMILGSVSAVSASKTITYGKYKTTITDSQWEQVKNGEKDITKVVGYKTYKEKVPVYKYKKVKAYKYKYITKLFKQVIDGIEHYNVNALNTPKGYKRISMYNNYYGNGDVYTYIKYKSKKKYSYYKKVKYVHHYKKVNKKYKVYMNIFKSQGGQFPKGIWVDVYSKEPIGCKKLASI